MSAATTPVHGLSLTDPRCAEVLNALPGLSPQQHTPGPVAYEIWIKNDPVRVDGFIGDTQCTIRSRDAAWTPMKRTTDRRLAEWNLRDLAKCNPGIASHYEIREVPL